MFKNFKLIGIVCLVMAAMVAFSSCSKEQQIVGKWKITKAKLDGENIDADEGETWVFKEGGKCILHIEGEDWEGDYSVKKNTLSLDLGNDYKESTITVKRTFSGDLDLDEFSKKEMTVSGKLKFTYDYTDYEYGEHDSGTESWSLSYEFEKK